MSDTRAEHLVWCKERALAYLDRGDLTNALASFGSDMHKHPETTNPTVDWLLANEGFRCVLADDVVGMRRLIEGFR